MFIVVFSLVENLGLFNDSGRKGADHVIPPAHLLEISAHK